MKRIFSLLLFALVLSACQQTGATVIPTTDELSLYYGPPQPAIIVINGRTYTSEIGNSMWIYIDSSGDQYLQIGDAFAIITPIQPIVVTSPCSAILELPIPMSPTTLSYRLISVTEKDGIVENNNQIRRWNPTSNPESILPPLEYQQELTFSPTPGNYVLDIIAGWGGTEPHVRLQANYGFFIEVQE